MFMKEIKNLNPNMQKTGKTLFFIRAGGGIFEKT